MRLSELATLVVRADAGHTIYLEHATVTVGDTQIVGPCYILGHWVACEDGRGVVRLYGRERVKEIRPFDAREPKDADDPAPVPAPAPPAPTPST